MNIHQVFTDLLSFNMANNHGGQREGAGRKKKEPTTTMRVPVSLVEAVKKFIKENRKHTAK